MALFEQGGIAVLDHDRCPGQRRQIPQGVAELAAGHAAHEVSQRFPLHGRHQPPAGHHAIVTTRQRPDDRRHRLRREPVRIALPRVDHDLEFRHPGRPRRRQRHIGAGLLAGPGRLPEHHLPSPGPGEDDLRPVLTPPVGHDVDRRAPPDTGPQRNPLHHVAVRRPRFGRHRQQNKAFVRGQVPAVRNTSPPLIGSRNR